MRYQMIQRPSRTSTFIQDQNQLSQSAQHNYQAKNPLPFPLHPSFRCTPTALRKRPGTILPLMMVSSTTRGISCGVTRPYETYAPEGKRILGSAFHSFCYWVLGACSRCPLARRYGVHPAKMTSPTPSRLSP